MYNAHLLVIPTRKAAKVLTPKAGEAELFVDSTSLHLCQKDENGKVIDLASTAASPNSQTYAQAIDGKINFVVDGKAVGNVQWNTANNQPKWTLNGILDPNAYAGNPLTIAQRDALVPAAGWLVYVHDGTVNEYQLYTGVSWISLGGGGASVTFQPDVSSLVLFDTSNLVDGSFVYERTGRVLYVLDKTATSGDISANPSGFWKISAVSGTIVGDESSIANLDNLQPAEGQYGILTTQDGTNVPGIYRASSGTFAGGLVLGVASNIDWQFLASTGISPSVAGNPTEAEITTWAAGKTPAVTSAFIRYTGTVSKTDATKYAFYVDSKGEARLLSKPDSAPDGFTPWQANKLYTLPAMVSRAVGGVQEYLVSAAISGTRTSGATFDATEAGGWVRLQQDATAQAFPANAYVYKGFQYRANGILFEANASFQAAATQVLSNWYAYPGTGWTLWAANTPYGAPANKYWTYANGVTIFFEIPTGGAPGTTGTILDAAEIAKWTYVSQSAIPTAYQPSITIIKGYKMALNGKVWQSKTNHVSGATFDATELANWEVIGAMPSTVQTVTGTTTLTAWNTEVEINISANANITFPPIATSDIGSTITFRRADTSSATVTLISNAGQTFNLSNAGKELNITGQALTVTAIDATNIRQTGGTDMTIAVIGEAGISIAPAGATAIPANSWGNVITGIAIPSAGRYRIRYQTTCQHSSAGNAIRWQMLNAGVQVPDSYSAMEYPTGTDQLTASHEFDASFTSAATLSLQGWGNLGGANCFQNTDGSTRVTWMKISGNQVLVGAAVGTLVNITGTNVPANTKTVSGQACSIQLTGIAADQGLNTVTANGTALTMWRDFHPLTKVVNFTPTADTVIAVTTYTFQGNSVPVYFYTQNENRVSISANNGTFSFAIPAASLKKADKLIVYTSNSGSANEPWQDVVIPIKFMAKTGAAEICYGLPDSGGWMKCTINWTLTAAGALNVTLMNGSSIVRYIMGFDLVSVGALGGYTPPAFIPNNVTVTAVNSAGGAAVNVNNAASITVDANAPQFTSVTVQQDYIMTAVTATNAVVNGFNTAGGVNYTPTGAGAIVFTCTFASVNKLRPKYAKVDNTDVTFGTIAVKIPASGNHSLQIRSDTGVNITADIQSLSMDSGNKSAIVDRVITTTMTNITAWDFTVAGAWQLVHVFDKTNGRVFRITSQIGSGYLSNDIVCEEL